MHLCFDLWQHLPSVSGECPCQLLTENQGPGRMSIIVGSSTYEYTVTHMRTHAPVPTTLTLSSCLHFGLSGQVSSHPCPLLLLSPLPRMRSPGSYMTYYLTSIMSLFKCYLFSKAYPDRPISNCNSSSSKLGFPLNLLHFSVKQLFSNIYCLFSLLPC